MKNIVQKRKEIKLRWKIDDILGRYKAKQYKASLSIPLQTIQTWIAVHWDQKWAFVHPVRPDPFCAEGRRTFLNQETQRSLHHAGETLQWRLFRALAINFHLYEKETRLAADLLLLMLVLLSVLHGYLSHYLCATKTTPTQQGGLLVSQPGLNPTCISHLCSSFTIMLQVARWQTYHTAAMFEPDSLQSVWTFRAWKNAKRWGEGNWGQIFARSKIKFKGFECSKLVPSRPTGKIKLEVR